jgi:hypothetical protein
MNFNKKYCGLVPTNNAYTEVWTATDLFVGNIIHKNSENLLEVNGVKLSVADLREIISKLKNKT